ncbi:hypothetical protein Fmac_021352 [Flemingia macrophylla]|uniref:Uncharacterized protein n=1 Tax=Flemingia macrophylla TaxID=520843 RepID=A0ABD1LWN6_9FABA
MDRVGTIVTIHVSIPIKNYRLSSDANANANANATVVSGNGTSNSSKYLGGSKLSTMAFRSMTVVKGSHGPMKMLMKKCNWANDSVWEASA